MWYPMIHNPHSYVNDVTEQVEPMSEKDRCSDRINVCVCVWTSDIHLDLNVVSDDPQSTFLCE
jgi:hypothetical protein